MDFLVFTTVPDFMAQKIVGEDKLCFKEVLMLNTVQLMSMSTH